jgi:hypothetical protein
VDGKKIIIKLVSVVVISITLQNASNSCTWKKGSQFVRIGPSQFHRSVKHGVKLLVFGGRLEDMLSMKNARITNNLCFKYFVTVRDICNVPRYVNIGPGYQITLDIILKYDFLEQIAI